MSDCRYIFDSHISGLVDRNYIYDKNIYDFLEGTAPPKDVPSETSRGQQKDFSVGKSISEDQNNVLGGASRGKISEKSDNEILLELESITKNIDNPTLDHSEVEQYDTYNLENNTTHCPDILDTLDIFNDINNI